MKKTDQYTELNEYFLPLSIPAWATAEWVPVGTSLETRH